MIPKVIHYCWFGGKPLPKSAQKCIASWRKFFPDFEIKEWNESNFDVNAIPYTEAAYKAGKYAFVSDFARFKILHEQGGVYFDTDVEVIAPFDDILMRGGFMGYETPGHINAGVGMAAPSHEEQATNGPDVLAEILKEYDGLEFKMPTPGISKYTIVWYTMLALHKLGVPENENCIRTIGAFTLYPSDWFNPLDDATGQLNKTKNTRSIHWFSKTWEPGSSPFKQSVTRLLRRLMGKKLRKALRSIIKRKPVT